MSDLVDAHVHLWNRATDPQPWIEPESMAVIDRDFGSGDLAAMLDATGIGTAVVVQSSTSLDETRRLLADPGSRIAAVVGWADLTTDVEAQLDTLGTEARQRLAGIRHLVHLDPDPGWLSRPATGRGLAVLADRGLCFDLVVRSWQLPAAAGVAAAHPGLRFVLDHLGGIAETDDDQEWERGFRALAALPHAYAKISGLASLVHDPDRLRRVTDVALDAFGPHRLMYGSDWPLARLSAGPVAWRAAVDGLIAGLSPDERHAILSGVATTCYGLGA